MKSTLRFALIGCGRIADRHATEMVKHGQLAAVCDIVKEKADTVAEKFAAIPYYSISDLLANEKGIDVVAICTPNGLHAEHSILSMQAGHHVLCEKPMALSSTDAGRMIETAATSGKQLFIVKQNRFNPPVAFVKQLLENKKLGKIFSFQINCFWNRPPAYYQHSWLGTKELDGGTLFTQFSHFIDLLYWLLGDVAAASGIRSNYAHKDMIEFEDTGVAFLQMTDGPIGTIHYTINSHPANMEGSLVVFGEKGTVKIGGQYLNELEYFSVEGMDKPDLPEGNPPNQYGFYQGSMSNHDKVYEMLVRAVNEPSFSFITTGETRKAIEIIEKIYGASPLV
ncbi:MAG: Gfo/Idh/MocA family oxidoreductase [Chitinophagaceae bacterium]|nr:Gfo/Idh/MocA family oxidoreductase [Chitinophagaceae bacterium]